MKPSITVAMLSFNDERIIEECLSSIRNQDYDQSLIEILMVDGGSSDSTQKIAEKYRAKFLFHPELRDRPDIRGGMALSLPKSDLILFFSADNRIMESDTLSHMVEVFKDESIVGCETFKYGFRKSDPILSRYFALIGGVDPIAIGLGKADRAPFDIEHWHSFGTVEDKDFYFKVGFEKDLSRIPTLGANGFLVRRALIQKSDLMKHAVHIDICADLILNNFNHFAFIKKKYIVHFIDVGLISFLKRKIFLTKMYSADNVSRLYSVFHRRDSFRLIFLVFLNLTFIGPSMRALKGYMCVRDRAWFLHPLMCFVFTVNYGFFYSKRILSKVFKALTRK